MFEADRSTCPSRWEVIRVAAGHGTEATLLSRRFFALTTHWVRTTMPCCGDDCRLCELLPARGLFYCAVLCYSRVCIVELGAQSASHFEQHAKLLHGGMEPGLVVKLTRSGPKKPVKSEGLRMQPGHKEVEPLDLARHVMAIFKFPPPNPGDDLNTFERRCQAIARMRCDRAAEAMLLNERKR